MVTTTIRWQSRHATRLWAWCGHLAVNTKNTVDSWPRCLASFLILAFAEVDCPLCRGVRRTVKFIQCLLCMAL